MYIAVRMTLSTAMAATTISRMVAIVSGLFLPYVTLVTFSFSLEVTSALHKCIAVEPEVYVRVQPINQFRVEIRLPVWFESLTVGGLYSVRDGDAKEVVWLTL